MNLIDLRQVDPRVAVPSVAQAELADLGRRGLLFVSRSKLMNLPGRETTQELQELDEQGATARIGRTRCRWKEPEPCAGVLHIGESSGRTEIRIDHPQAHVACVYTTSFHFQLHPYY